jgi:hypothetical protein
MGGQWTGPELVGLQRTCVTVVRYQEAEPRRSTEEEEEARGASLERVNSRVFAAPYYLILLESLNFIF